MAELRSLDNLAGSDSIAINKHNASPSFPLRITNLNALPSELLEMIVWYSFNVNLLLVNKRLATNLPAPRKFMHSLLTLAICGDRHIMIEVLGTTLGVSSAPTSIKYNLQKRLQRSVFNQSWCTAERFNRVAFCIARAWLKRWIPESQAARYDSWTWWDAQNCANFFCQKAECSEAYGYSLAKLLSQELRWRPKLDQSIIHVDNLWELSLETPAAFKLFSLPQRAIQSRQNTATRELLTYLAYFVDELDGTGIVSHENIASDISAIQSQIKIAVQSSDHEAVWALSRIERSLPTNQYTSNTNRSSWVRSIFPKSLNFRIHDFTCARECRQVLQSIHAMAGDQPFPSFPAVIETLFHKKDWTSIARMLYTYCKLDTSAWMSEEPRLAEYCTIDRKSFFLMFDEPGPFAPRDQTITLIIHEFPTMIQRIAALSAGHDMYNDSRVEENSIRIRLSSSILEQTWRFRPGPDLNSRSLNEEIPENISRHLIDLSRTRVQQAEKDEDEYNEGHDSDSAMDFDSDNAGALLPMRPLRPRNRCPPARNWSVLQ